MLEDEGIEEGFGGLLLVAIEAERIEREAELLLRPALLPRARVV